MKATHRTVRLQLSEPLRISRSTTTARDAVWITVTHEGHSGHGEAVSSVFYGLDTATIQRHLTRIGREELPRFSGPESALQGLSEGELATEGAPPAVTAAVESALLDLVGKRAGVPVHRLVGAPGAPVATALTIGITSPLHAARQARNLVESGFRIIKVKAGTPDPEDDIERVRAIRDAAPHARLLLDPNGAWTVPQARKLLHTYAELGIEAVEQPVAPGDPEAFGALAERSPLPLIADEDAVSLADARRLAGRVHGINVKLAKCGGVHAAARIAALLEGSGTDLMLGCLTASTLGLAPAVHLASRARWADLDGHLLLAYDPWTGIGGTDGTVVPNGLPGLGVAPREYKGTKGAKGSKGERAEGELSEGERAEGDPKEGERAEGELKEGERYEDVA
ncbi:dipeptide epimerase [Streptomyces kunmingensis]|uniref:Dipeptide epimerase n=1 Tax=Streptomyces kunmingensis TaxID=68225 RepID=A0ABU6CQB1_9ACTN|nr:dipeptide epimerase [Streptomyces kunmingensis]MEB3966828.1 dipeptide epimerase [Streptomyces kunmingensis]